MSQPPWDACDIDSQFVCILFTDLVDSTGLYRRLGDEQADAMRRTHFDALRGAVAEHAGREVKSTGDGLMVAFTSAVGAVRCAVAMQRAVAGDASGLGLRVGLDAGEPMADGDDLYGTPVIVASRLCDTADTGEILLTETVRRLTESRVTELIRPAGTLRLRGIEDPVSTAIVDWDGSPAPPEAASAARPITVVVADDERLIRVGFRVIIESEGDLTVVGEAEDGQTAVSLVRRTRPDVVLMDIRMPGMNGLEAAERVLSDPDLSTGVIMLTTFDASEYVYEALRIGASGFLLKDAPAERLLDAIRVVASGEALLAPSITRRLISKFTHAARVEPGDVPARVSELTARELEVLRLVAQGLSNAEIAKELFLGENTVKTHVGRMLSKLGLRDRVQAVVLAYETGVVTPEGGG